MVESCQEVLDLPAAFEEGLLAVAWLFSHAAGGRFRMFSFKLSPFWSLKPLGAGRFGPERP